MAQPAASTQVALVAQAPVAPEAKATPPVAKAKTAAKPKAGKTSPAQPAITTRK